MDELEHERSAGDNALTTREEVTTNDPISQELGVSDENHNTVDGRLTFQARWTFLQTGSRPFTRQSWIRDAFNHL